MKELKEKILGQILEVEELLKIEKDKKEIRKLKARYKRLQNMLEEMNN